MLRSYVKGPRRTLPSHYFMNYARCKQCDNRVMWVACASTNPSDSPDAACPNPNSPSTGPWWLLGASWRTWGGRRRRQPCRPRRRHRYWCWVSGWACPWWWWVSDVRIALLAIGALSAWRFRWLLWKIERFLGPWGQGQCGGGWPTAVCVYMCIYNIPCVVWVGALECLLAIMDYGTEWQSLYAMLVCLHTRFSNSLSVMRAHNKTIHSTRSCFNQCIIDEQISRAWFSLLLFASFALNAISTASAQDSCQIKSISELEESKRLILRHC